MVSLFTMERSEGSLEFRTSRSVVLPLGAIVVVSLALLLTVFAKGEKGFAAVVLCLLVPLALLFLSWLKRGVEVNDEGITYKTLLRKRRVKWGEVRDIRLFTAGLRRVLYLDGGDKVLLIPLSMERKGEFLDTLRLRLEGMDLPKEGLDTLAWGGGFAAEPLFLWVAAVVLAIILVLRLR